MNTTFRIPLNALLLVTLITTLLQLINIGSTTAFFAILSLNTLALYISYILPILFVFIHKLDRLCNNGASGGIAISSSHNTNNTDTGRPTAPFAFLSPSLMLLVNAFALVYAIFIVIWLPFPSVVPVDAQTMNYGGPVMGAVIIFGILDWVIGGAKRRFCVPGEGDAEI